MCVCRISRRSSTVDVVEWRKKKCALWSLMDYEAIIVHGLWYRAERERWHWNYLLNSMKPQYTQQRIRQDRTLMMWSVEEEEGGMEWWWEEETLLNWWGLLYSFKFYYKHFHYAYFTYTFTFYINIQSTFICWNIFFILYFFESWVHVFPATLKHE